MPIKTPIVYRAADSVAAKDILIGDIIQWKAKPDDTVPKFGIVIDPTTITSQSGQTPGIYVLPIRVLPYEKMVQNSHSNYMLPDKFLKQGKASRLNRNNNYLLEFKLVPVPLQESHTECEGQKVLRVGSLFEDTTGTTERILDHAFKTIGTAGLLAAQGRLRTQTDLFNKMSGNDEDELPEIGAAVFNPEFLNPELTTSLATKSPRIEKVNIAKFPLIQTKKPKGEIAEILSTNPDNIQGLLRAGSLREKSIWRRVIEAMPDDTPSPNINDLLLLDEDELLGLRDILLNGDFDDQQRLNFIRTVELFCNGQNCSELYRFITYDNIARDFQKEHPRAYGHVYRALSSGQTFEEIIQGIHESDDNNIRKYAVPAVLNASYLFMLEKHEFTPAPDLTVEEKMTREEFVASLDVTLVNAHKMGLIKLQSGMRQHNLTKLFNSPKDGAPNTMREAYKQIQDNNKALKGKFDRAGEAVACDLAIMIEEAIKLFENKAEEYLEFYGEEAVFSRDDV